MVKVAPVYSSGLSFLFFARSGQLANLRGDCGERFLIGELHDRSDEAVGDSHGHTDVHIAVKDDRLGGAVRSRGP